MSVSDRSDFRREVLLSHLQSVASASEGDAFSAVLSAADVAGTVSSSPSQQKLLTTVSVRPDGVAIITIDNPPVNALSALNVASIDASFQQASADPAVRAIVLTGAGQAAFVAGADISFLQEQQEKKLCPLSFIEYGNGVLNAIEKSTKPVVAALNGVTLGGGLELAMACHARVAAQNVVVGLPELKLGVIPGFGGTQRLPRLVGVAKACEMILTSKQVPAKEAAQIGLVDSVVATSVVDAAVALCNDFIRGQKPLRRALQLQIENKEVALADIAKARKLPVVKLPFHLAALNAIEAGVLTSPFTGGFAAEGNEFARCLHSPESRALVHFFFASRNSSKVPSSSNPNQFISVAKVSPKTCPVVGVVGGGLMGAGIATAALLAGFRVLVKEINPQLAEAGKQRIVQNLKGRKPVDIGKMLNVQTDWSGFEQCGVVIEAVLEIVDLKRKVFAEIEKVVSPSCILASNTSTISLRVIGENLTTNQKKRLVGLHFFSPAHLMPLLEIVRDDMTTSEEAVAFSLGFSAALGKTAIVVGNCSGFAANRVFLPYGEAAHFLVDSGVCPYAIDKALEKFGFPMGVFRMSDMAGLHISASAQKYMQAAYPDRAYVCQVANALVKDNKIGEYSNEGFYVYKTNEKGRKDASQNPNLSRYIDDARARRPIAFDATGFSSDEIVDLIVFSVVNECCRVLDEGYAIRADDLDVASVTGYAFPAHRGGVMKYAAERGWDVVADRLAQFFRVTGLELLRPCDYLTQLANKTAKRGKKVFEKSDDDVVIVAATRSAMGRAKRGSFAETRPDLLLTPILKALLQKSKIDPSLIDDIIIGTVLPKSDVGAVETRIAGLAAGIPSSTSVRCLNRLCSSGMQAMCDGAAAIQAGYSNIVIAGGVESMSINPFDWTLVPKNEAYQKAGITEAMDCYLPMGITAENVARKYGVSRVEQDLFAVESNRRALNAIQNGYFAQEITPIETTLQGKSVVVSTDEGPRDTTIGSLMKLRPAFIKDGCSTAGNSSQLTDGAAAVLMMKRSKARELGMTIVGVWRGAVCVGVPPNIMGVGPSVAIPALFKKYGVEKDDIDVYEINEAFAPVPMVASRLIGLDASKVNPNGGAIAMGHPLGCTGARIAVSSLYHLQRTGGRFACLSACVGTGMGYAVLLEKEY
eukprot:ANDGO_06968.mRNA.1 Glyoxysomal fatty acid beta-oxidation multifunctional protein MFP-a